MLNRRPPLWPLALSLLLVPAPSAAQGGAASSGLQEGSGVYRHPAGFSVRYPSGWRVQETLEGIYLVPGDAATDAMGQPKELFILGSDDAPGITDPMDPMVVAYFQESMQGFRLAGPPQRMESGLGAGAVLTFEGSLGGPPLRQRTYVALHQGKGIFLAHLATTDVAARRDAQAREIFQSFTWGDAARDQALVGSWSMDASSSSEDAYGDYAAVDRTSQYWFAADGSVRHDSESSVSVDVEGVSGLSTSGARVRQGTWSAGQGVLYMRFQDGTEEEFRYALTQDGSGQLVLELRDAQGTVSYYRRAG